MKRILHTMSYYPEPDSSSRSKIKVVLDLSNYATKFDVQRTADITASLFAKKINLANLKLDFDRLYIDKSDTSPIDLSKLSNVVKNILLKSLYGE